MKKVGMGFPFRIGKNGGVSESSNTKLNPKRCKEELTVLLGTFQNERVMYPEKGNPLNMFVFENIDESMYGLIRYHLLELFKNEATLFEVEDEEDITFRKENNKVFITVNYRDVEYGDSHMFTEEIGGAKLERL